MTGPRNGGKRPGTTMRSANGAAHTNGESTSSVRRLASLLRPYRWRLIAALAMLIALTAANLAIPALIATVFNEVFPHKNWVALWWVLIGILIAYLARNLLYFGSKITAVNIGEEVSFSLRSQLFDRLQQMNLRFYQKNKPGQVSSRVMNDSFVVQMFIQDDLPTMLQSSLLFVGLVAALFAVNWQLAAACTVVLPLHLATYYWFRRPIKQASHVAQEQLAVATGNLVEKFLGMEVVKSFTAEAREGEAFQQAIDESRRSNLRSKTYHVSQKMVADVLIGLSTICLLGFGAYQVMGPAQMGVGTFVGFFVLVKMLYPTVLDLMSSFAKLTRSTASIDRVFEMLGSTEVETAGTAASRPKPLRGEVRFERINYRYSDGPMVLRDIGFEIPAGSICGVIGPSGAGKTTLANLIPRFLEPSQGRVMIDGKNARLYDPRHLRAAIGIAAQEPFLFDSSIVENIRYGKPDATMHQIVQMARLTGAHEFIARLPAGYGTLLGPKGMALSRGEKQRLTLTRALLKDPRILILDEATASIDKPTAQSIIPAILKYMDGRTVIMITHDPNMLRWVDRVIQIDQGRVIHQGAADRIHRDRLVGEPPQMTDASDTTEQSSGTGRLMLALLCAATFALSGGSAIAQQTGPAPQAVKQAPKAPAQPAPQVKPTYAQFLPMTGLNTVETAELLDVTQVQLTSTLDYKSAPRAIADLPNPPQGMAELRVLARSSDAGLHVLRIGYRPFKSQPPHVWIGGRVLAEDGKVQPNPDLSRVVAMLANARKTLQQQYANTRVADLSSHKLHLSYVDPMRCIQTLQSMGYTIAQPGKPINTKELPAVMALPATTSHNLVGGPYSKSNTPKNADFPLTETDPISDLLIFYHPARPEQLSLLLDKINTIIDRPARQILIEAMVLEISQTGLKQLGVEWELESKQGNISALTIGKLPTFDAGQSPTADITLSNIFGEFSVKIKALIKKGDAKVLSRPSVLTLDNRMANIAVEKRIPVVKSVLIPRSDIVTVNFDDSTTTGITLNVRPRVTANSEEISMQVVASVSAEVPGEEVVVTDSQGNEIASSPTITSREVKTYTRIANNTPFIIGGLINEDNLSERSKVPLLGDLPLIGEPLFTDTRIDTVRREVIIVITPYVLPETQVAGRNMPMDEDAFDSFGAALFRDAYRIRAEDVYDLGFLLNNQRLRAYKRLADMAVRRNITLAEQYPFNRFIGKRVPGERILVYRQMYEVIKRLGMDRKIDVERLIYFEPSEAAPAGFQVNFLHKYLASVSGVKPKSKLFSDDLDFAPLWEAMGPRAVALTYTLRPYGGSSDILSQPVPEVKLYDCPDEDTYERLLWQLNQPDHNGMQRHTILLRNAKDARRLKHAILLKRTARLNANRQELTLSNFSLGRQLLMPTVKPNKIYLIDEETARLFFFSEQYYAALESELSRDLKSLHNALKLPDINRLLDKPLPQFDLQAPVLDIDLPGR